MSTPLHHCKHILAAAICVAATGLHAQDRSSTTPTKRPQLSKHRTVEDLFNNSRRPHLAGQVREAFYTEDFSGGAIPAGWTNVDDLTPAGEDPVIFVWSNAPSDVGVAAGSYANIMGSFGAPGASNGYLWANSDRGLPSAPISDHLTRLTTSAIDCSGQVSVMLSMQTAIGVFDNDATDFVKIRVSTDLTNWTDFVPFPCLVTGSPTPPCSRFSDNPELVAVDISSVAASQPEVYIQFQWEGGWEYWWGIDDLQLSPLPDYEIVMNFAYNSTTGTGEEYGRIPSDQLPGTMNVGAELRNFGANEQTNVAVNVAFEDEGGAPVPGFSTSIPVGSIPSGQPAVADADLNIPANLANGVYTSTFTISGDNVALDDDPSDNERTRNFEVTTDIYSLDAIGNHPAGTETLLQYGTATFEDNAVMNYMNMYFVNAPMTVTGIVVSFGTASVAGTGAEIEVFLLDTADVFATPSNITLPVDGVTSGIRDVTQADLDLGTIAIPLEQAVTLAPGAYYAVARVSGSGTVPTVDNTDPEVYILDDATVPQPGVAAAIYLPIDFNDDGTEGQHFYSNGEAFAIRLTTLPTVGINEPAQLTGISLFPNPTEGVFQICSDRTEVLFVEVTDALGQIVHTTNFSAAKTIDLGQLAAGVYNVAISNGTERTIERVTLK